MLRADHIFHDIVVDISRGDVDLTAGEALLFQRTVTDLYNPRGVYWSIIGYTFTRRFLRRGMLASIVGGLYTLEASWAAHDKFPVQSFFRDLSMFDPQHSSLARRMRANFPRLAADKVCDRRSVASRMWDFAVLQRTRASFFSPPLLHSPATPASPRGTGVGSIRCEFPTSKGGCDVADADAEFVISRRTSPCGFSGIRVLRGGSLQGAPFDFNELFQQQQTDSGKRSPPTADQPPRSAASFLKDIEELKNTLVEKRAAAKQLQKQKQQQQQGAVKSQDEANRAVDDVSGATAAAGSGGKNAVVIPVRVGAVGDQPLDARDCAAGIRVRDVPLKAIWACVAGDVLSSGADVLTSPVWWFYKQLGLSYVLHQIRVDPPRGGGGGGRGPFVARRKKKPSSTGNE